MNLRRLIIRLPRQQGRPRHADRKLHVSKMANTIDIYKVADIPPQGRELGLRAFLCPECGAVDSVLIHPDTRFGPKATELGDR